MTSIPDVSPGTLSLLNFESSKQPTNRNQYEQSSSVKDKH